MTDIFDAVEEKLDALQLLVDCHAYKTLPKIVAQLVSEVLCESVTDQDIPVIAQFFQVRKEIRRLREFSGMDKIYPADMFHFLYDVLVWALRILKRKHLKISKRELKCLMLGLMLHDADRNNNETRTRREKGLDGRFIESYRDYKIRHSQNSLSMALQIFSSLEIILEAEELDIIRKIILGHDIRPQEGDEEYHFLVPIASLADKLSFYSKDFTRIYFTSHSEEQAIEKMGTMFLQLSPEECQMVDALPKEDWFEPIFLRMKELMRDTEAWEMFKRTVRGKEEA